MEINIQNQKSLKCNGNKNIKKSIEKSNKSIKAFQDIVRSTSNYRISLENYILKVMSETEANFDLSSFDWDASGSTDPD